MIFLSGFIVVILSYLLGSVPVGYLLVKVLQGKDIRDYGSGNIGATNVVRVVGKRVGIVTLLLDILKGLITVTVIPLIAGNVVIVKLLCAFAVVAGHNWPVFLKFRGGKGVATTAGVLIGLVPKVFVSAVCVWGIVFTIWKYVSLASIAAAISLPLFMFIYQQPGSYQIMGLVVAIIGIWRHRSNINRLCAGKENKFRWRKK